MPKKEHKVKIILANEGLNSVLLFASITVISIVVKCNLLAITAFIITTLIIIAFRDLERFINNRHDNSMLAPCDGIIKDINVSDIQTRITIKVNTFDCGMIRNPTYIDKLDSKCSFGLFAPKKYDVSILNTKYTIDGIKNSNVLYTITLLPEIWNQTSIYINKNITIGDRIAYMKYGLLVLKVNKAMDIMVNHGDNIFAGETLIGKIK